MLGRGLPGEKHPHPNPSPAGGRGARSYRGQRIPLPLPFAARKGGSNSGSAEPCSAGGLPGEKHPHPNPSPAGGRGTRSYRGQRIPQTLPFAARNGGSNSGSAEPCSAGACPAKSTLTPNPSPAGGRGARNYRDQRIPLPLPFAARKGGSNSGNAEPCSAGACPAKSPLTPTPLPLAEEGLGIIATREFPYPSPSLRETEAATAVVPSHARQGLARRKAPSPQPLSRWRERGSELSRPENSPTPPLRCAKGRQQQR